MMLTAMMLAAAAPAAPAPAAAAAAAPAPVDYAARLSEGDVTLPGFAFASGERIEALRQHYATLGSPRRNARGEVVNAVMVLHGTGGSGRQFLQPQFAQALFGPGQPLDIARYFVILPDSIGHGQSSKPSDGLRAGFPRYDYRDMVAAQAAMLDRLGVRRLRLLMGTSMGCMQGFVWAETRAPRIQAMMPLACMPMAMSGHNRMWRHLSVEAVRADPAYQGGNYTSQPLQGLRAAASISALQGFAPAYLAKQYPTPAAADAYIDERVAKDIASRDANDMIWQLEASRTYAPDPARIRGVAMTWVNSSDDAINPAGYGDPVALAKVMGARFVMIPGSAETRGHGTHTWAKFWGGELTALLARTEGR